ncbi:hypothetical protein MTO96_013672 [Rhipicephalus appendiculatus]
MSLAATVNSFAPSDVGSVTEGVLEDWILSIVANTSPSSVALKTSGIRHPPSTCFTCDGIERAGARLRHVFPSKCQNDDISDGSLRSAAEEVHGTTLRFSGDRLDVVLMRGWVLHPGTDNHPPLFGLSLGQRLGRLRAFSLASAMQERELGLAPSCSASASTTATLTSVFDRQQRKRTAVRVASLVTRRMPVSHGTGFAFLAPGTFHRSLGSATAKAWKIERGPNSLPAALSATLQCLLCDIFARSSPVISVGRAIEGGVFASGSIECGSSVPT